VPLETIEQVVKIVTDWAETWSKPARLDQNIFELTPYLPCAKCQQPLMGQTNRQKRRVYRHRFKNGCARITRSADEIEGAVYDLVALFKPSPEFIELVREEIEAAVAEESRGTADQEARTRLATVRRRLERLKRLFIEEEIEEYRAEKARYEAEITQLQARIGEAESEAFNVADIMAQMGEIETALREAEPHERKALLATVFTRIEVDLETLELVYWPAAWTKPFF
jgi:chromosome segregation ATPase